MNWYELKSKCIGHVAMEIAQGRLPHGHNQDPVAVRIERWNRLADEARDEAVEAIKAMNGLELIGLITEVTGEEHE